MSTALYQKCPLCKGTRVTQSRVMVAGMKRPGAKPYSGPLPAGQACFGCTDGYVETGLTLGQVEKAIDARRAKIAASITETDYATE